MSILQEIQAIIDEHGERVDPQGWQIAEPERGAAARKLMKIVEREQKEAIIAALDYLSDHVPNGSRYLRGEAKPEIFALMFPEL